MAIVLRTARRLKHKGYVYYKRMRLWWTYRARIQIFDSYVHGPGRLRQFSYNPNRYAHTFLARPSLGLDEPPSAPSIVWAIWLGGPITAPRRIALDLLHSLEGMDFRLVTDPGSVVTEGEPLHRDFDKLAPIHQSDYLRAYLMHHYGGIYVDIKRVSSRLAEVLSELNSDSTKWVVAYREVTSNYVGDLGYQLGADVRRFFPCVMGPSAFACKPMSPFTAEWIRELDRRMDYCSEALSEVSMVARNSYDLPYGYPIRWSEILADIIQPLSLKYNDRILFSDLIKPQLKNYR